MWHKIYTHSTRHTDAFYWFYFSKTPSIAWLGSMQNRCTAEVNQSQTTQYTALKHRDTTLWGDIWEIIPCCPCWTALWMMYAWGTELTGKGRGSTLARSPPAIPTHMFDWFPGNHRGVKSNSKFNSTVMNSANCMGPPGRRGEGEVMCLLGGEH